MRNYVPVNHRAHGRTGDPLPNARHKRNSIISVPFSFNYGSAVDAITRLLLLKILHGIWGGGVKRSEELTVAGYRDIKTTVGLSYRNGN